MENYYSSFVNDDQQYDDDDYKVINQLTTGRWMMSANESSPTSSPTTDTTNTKTRTDTEIILHTLRLYGTFYIVSLCIYTILRRYYPKLFNIRGWVPSLQCKLAMDTKYGYINWFYHVFRVTDTELFEQCGMDTLCFIRALRFGRILSLLGCANALWLIPLYATANNNDDDGNENSDEVIDPFVMITVSNLPSSSKRLLGPVIATYILCIYTMYFIVQEFSWFTKWRHLFLSLQTPQNYACYVCGIPEEYSTSYRLHEYFSICAGNVNAVVEAHVAMDTPKLDRLVSRREIVIRNLQQAVHAERRTGQQKSHHRIQIRRSSGGVVQKVNSVETYQKELDELNRQIERSIHEITGTNDKYRSQLFQQRQLNRPSRSLLLNIIDYGSSDDECNDGSPDDEYDVADNNKNHDDGSDHISISVDQQYDSTDPLIGTLSITARAEYDVNDDANAGSCGFRLEEIPELPETDTGGGSSIHETKSTSPNNNTGQPNATHSTSSVQVDSCCPDDDDCLPGEKNKNNNQRPSMLASYRTFRNIVEKKRDMNTSDEHHDDPGTPTTLPPPRSGMKQRQSNVVVHDDSHEEPSGSSEMVVVDFRKTKPASTSTSTMPCVSSETSSNNNSWRSIQSATTTNAEQQDASPPTKKNDSGSASLSQRSGSYSSRLSTSRASLQKAAAESAKIVKFKTLALTATATVSIASGSRAASQSILEVSRKTGETLKSVSKEINADRIMQTAGDTIGKTTEQVMQVGSQLITHAGAVVPILLTKSEGKPKYAGFVVFSNLYTAQAAVQMIHHTEPYVMKVTPAPQPDDIFWRNVGLPHRARRGGRGTAFACSAVLCFFWTVPMGIISSLTEINSLKLSMPKLGRFIDDHPGSERFFEQIAPLVLLFFNEAILPSVLKHFATWEGHVSASMLEVSLFVKLGVFMIIQTFFVSAISGGISAEISNILDDPESIIDFLAESLPAQSSYFIQITIASTFILQSIEVLRVYPLFLALLRRCVGPKLTPKDRQQTWGWFHSLEDPPSFWHAETFAQLILFYMVTFVYQPIAPVTSFFLCFCFCIVEGGYRFQMIHNYPVKFDTGGRLWKYWIHFTLASMIIAQLTLIGILSLKQSTLVGPVMVPLLVLTILFIIYINSEHSKMSEFLPTQECVRVDRERNAAGPLDMSFAKGVYLQPSLQTKIAEPDFDEGEDYYSMDRKRRE